MKRALFAIASVAIMATAVGVEAANAQYAPAPPAYTAPPAYGPSPSYTRSARRYPPTPYGGPGYGYGPGSSYFVCQAVGARSVGHGRAYFVADAKWQALIQCERYSGICIISYCVPAY
jgi:hypothetical protein